MNPSAVPNVRRSVTLAALIRFSQVIGRGNSKVSFNVLKDSFVETGSNPRTESDHEARGLNDFLDRFHSGILDDLRGRRILDLGCGYGGKAVELASRFPTSLIVGVEIHQKKIARGREYAQRRAVSNCEFRLCTQTTIPLDDESVDCIVCHDVLEHVHDPATVIGEMHRVLTPGGKAYIVFPPYDGPVSHHLDFITCMPMVHWFYRPEVVMVTVNSILSSEYGKRFKTPPQPMPAYSSIVGEFVLPSLNGLGTATLTRLVDSRFRIDSIERITLMDRLTRLGVSAGAASRLKHFVLHRFPAASDRTTITMALVLQKL